VIDTFRCLCPWRWGYTRHSDRHFSLSVSLALGLHAFPQENHSDRHFSLSVSLALGLHAFPQENPLQKQPIRTFGAEHTCSMSELLVDLLTLANKRAQCVLWCAVTHNCVKDDCTEFTTAHLKDGGTVLARSTRHKHAAAERTKEMRG
jgi:hypothetical protein